MATQVHADAVERVAGRRILVIIAHADDAALFAGGTIRRLSEAGCDVQIARYTDDRTDSDGLSAEATIDLNCSDFRNSSRILGASTLHSLGFPSDTLGDVARSVLRECAVRLIRTIRPYAVLTFDPYSAYGEDNQDHIRIAQEVDEAFWTSMFDKHHPEHQDEGLAPHGVVERWYFGRRLTAVTDVIDVSAVIDTKVAAAIAHRTMMDNLLNQLRLMGATAGIEAAALAKCLGNTDELISMSVRSAITEEFRIVRFAGFHELFDNLPTELSHTGEDPKS